MRTKILATVLLLGFFAACGAAAQAPASAQVVSTTMLDDEIRGFLKREITAHVADIKSLDPPPDRVVGALTIGEFSWGTFMRTLGDYSAFASTNTIAGHDVPQMIGKMAQIELSHGGKTWAQLYAAMALESYGRDLNHNALWQSLSSESKETYRALLDPGRFYDAKTHTLIHLPENYFGVAARIAAIDYDLGLNKDRASLDDLLNHAAAQFTSGALFADDSLPTGRYDRYSNEYARAIYDAGRLAGREDIVKAVSPSLKQQMKLWWDLLSPDGYGYPWGRSLGAISYMDTMEIVGFLGVHPEFRPAPLSQLAAAYNAAWTWLRNDFNKDTHLLNIFAFGRGDYGYITKEREWQQTTTFFAKIMAAHKMFMQTMTSEGIKQFALRPSFDNVARFEFFRDRSDRKFGVWLVRQGEIRFALPFVTGPKAATSDYEPMPEGFPGLAVPVEKIYPCLVPFLELEDGRTIAAADGADEIRPAPDGMSVTAVWKRWIVAGAKAGEPTDEGIVSEVTWSLQGKTLQRTETLTASKPLRVRRLWLAVPSPYDHLETLEADGRRIDRLVSDAGKLDVQVTQSDWPVQISAFATGDSPLGRSDRGPIPLQLILESKDISFSPDTPRKWVLILTIRR
ncbi:MAG TPA: hypothetical protein VN025_20625 [Candidatus Dormibacteraeota bacterium]|jgi:hypothetical protein|nr:hypothetical protein [Candidatus Dormibacteraeota bacterium]